MRAPTGLLRPLLVNRPIETTVWLLRKEEQKIIDTGNESIDLIKRKCLVQTRVEGDSKPPGLALYEAGIVGSDFHYPIRPKELL